MLRGAPPLLNIYALVDVAAICEEVVEAVYAGQVYQNVSMDDLTDLTATSRGRTSERGLSMIGRSYLTESSSLKSKRSVDIILDIEKGDYTFTTQPGALRRVIMNIFGMCRAPLMKVALKNYSRKRLKIYNLR